MMKQYISRWAKPHFHVLTLYLGNGSDSVFEKGRLSEKEGRTLQMTVMKNLMKALKCLVCSGKNFLSKFNVDIDILINIII